MTRRRTLSGDGVCRQAPVIFLVKAPEVGALSGPPPGFVSPVPVHRETQAFTRLDGRLPAKRPQLLRVQRVPIVVARAVLHEVLQGGRLSTQAQYRIRDLDAAHLGPGGDVVGAAGFALPQDPGDR